MRTLNAICINIVRGITISIIYTIQVKKLSSITIIRSDREVVDVYTQDSATGLI